MIKPSVIYIIVGTPGSGKTWVCNQLEDKFRVAHHDEHHLGGFKGFGGEDGYVKELARLARLGDRPVLGETPFSLSKIMEPLLAMGFDVRPVFILESEVVTRERYLSRMGKRIPQGHLTRIRTYRLRAKELKAPSGTSREILDYLKGV